MQTTAPILTDERVRRAFDQTLIQQMERLLGTSCGIGNLQMNTAAISCLIFLAERESQIKASSSDDEPERYTRGSFSEDLADAGLDVGEDVDKAIEELGEKGYLEIDSAGRFSAKEPTIAMARLLDRVFPGMPGMNFVAYLIQTMDEVTTGRKDLVIGARQLDQTLRLHGVALSKQRSERESPQGRPATQPQAPRDPLAAKRSLLQKLRERQARTQPQTRPAPAGGPAILTESGDLPQDEAGPEALEDDQPSAAVSEQAAQDISADAPSAENPAQCSGPERADLPEPALASPSVFEPSVEDPALPEDDEPALAQNDGEKEQETAGAVEETTPEETAQPGGPDIHDDDIQARVAAFEQELSMRCPVCSDGRVELRQTAKGRGFYVCTRSECVFVSWGKPYYVQCPVCGNPFLVETADRHGHLMLKCPRATCLHQQPLPRIAGNETSQLAAGVASLPQQRRRRVVARTPRKKVVRRRMVRKKA